MRTKEKKEETPLHELSIALCSDNSARIFQNQIDMFQSLIPFLSNQLGFEVKNYKPYSVDSLIEDMDKENSLYKELYKLAKEKSKAIVTSDIGQLQAILGHEEAMISKISKVEKDRLLVVNEICNLLHLPSKDVKVEEIVEMLRKRPKEHDRLEESYLALKRVLKSLIQINDNNKFLLKESMEMMEFNINLARAADFGSQTGNYAKTARESMPVGTGRTSFDAKQ